VNVCRYRRHEVLSGSGQVQVLRCPYHAWTYDLEGGLKAAPGAGDEPGFDLGDFPLLRVKVGVLGPFVFVSADPDLPPVETYYGGLLRAMAGCGLDLDGLVLHSREEWHSGANWKTLLENYLECYHCPIAHPAFSAVVDVDRDRYELSAQGACLSQIAQVRPPGPEAAYDARGPITQAQYHLAWPNGTFNINPGLPNLSVDVWHPDGVHATRGFTEQYFGPGVAGAWAEALVQFNRQVGVEDDRLTDSVQRGLAAGIPEMGRILTRRERLILAFQRRVVEAVVN
jgi:phenylpropionate dioxygenase-like ring-hydroxylating dioxygenase large terminal subunit